jgi:hypothetical protein
MIVSRQHRTPARMECHHNASPVTSATGVNGDGRGALLAFDTDGKPLGVFSSDVRIADPRGLAVEPGRQLLF